jgi:hypothetical protein
MALTGTASFSSIGQEKVAQMSFFLTLHMLTG